MPVYGLMADLHCHNWSSFAGVDAEGRNTRLMDIIHEIHRCCAEVRKRGGGVVIIAGDLFHTRGSVSPSVFNPLRDALEDEVHKHNMVFQLMPGNHDLEGKTITALGSAVEMLGGLDQVYTVANPDGQLLTRFKDGLFSQYAVMVPWEGNAQALIEKAKKFVDADPLLPLDLIIHAGIDGVLSGMPDHGLTADMLADLGYRRVFAGHYHNHKDLGRGVFSIGATTHQTWSDINTRAGWLVVDDERVTFFASHAPQFLDLSGEEDPEELPLIVDGHYVRARLAEATANDVNNLRKSLLDMGARGVLVQSVPSHTAGLRTGTLSAASVGSLDRSIADYCKAKGLPPEVALACDNLLKEVRA